jgi:hypothetical protein
MLGRKAQRDHCGDHEIACKAAPDKPIVSPLSGGGHRQRSLRCVGVRPARWMRALTVWCCGSVEEEGRKLYG